MVLRRLELRSAGAFGVVGGSFRNVSGGFVFGWNLRATRLGVVHRPGNLCSVVLASVFVLARCLGVRLIKQPIQNYSREELGGVARYLG